MQIDGGGSRERRHGAALEPLAQRIDALGREGARDVTIEGVRGEATECVVAETASKGGQSVIGQ